MSDPYLIEGPALVSFSGGRTSAFMLHQILRAHAGSLPNDVVVAFNNTGRERPETLRFVHECSIRWGVNVHWLEYRPGGYENVGFNSASRAGEPFAALIDKKGFVPNRGAPFCSIELKARVTRDFLRDQYGWKNWNSVLGLRYDEGLRVMKALARNETGKDPWRCVMPMAKARHVKADVMKFWFGDDFRQGELARFIASAPSDLPQGFDLGLLDEEGNCDLCWKKSLTKRDRLIRRSPDLAAWWIEQEQKADRRGGGGSLFDERISVADLLSRSQQQADLFGGVDSDPDFDAECGLHCEADE